MTFFAGRRSWNFCGRRGVNSSTALRTVVGSNEDITWTELDLNRETDRTGLGHCDSVVWTLWCLSKVVDNAWAWPVRGRGQYEALDCLRTARVRGRCLVVDC